MTGQYQKPFIIICFILSLTIIYGITVPKHDQVNITIGAPIEFRVWYDYFDPETALGHGISGCVEVEYDSEIPPITIVSPGQQVEYPITYSLIPYSDNLTETIIVLDPSTGGSGGMNGVNFNDYVSYSPNVFILKEGSPIQVTMTYKVSEESSEGFSAPTNELIGVGTHSVLPVKGGNSGWYSNLDLDWANTLIENNMSVTPGWFMVNRFGGTSHPETIVPVDNLDFERYPKLREGFDVDEKWVNSAHPGEWVECSSQEGIEIVEYLGGEIWAPYGDSFRWHKDIRYDGLNFSLVIYFTETAPPIF